MWSALGNKIEDLTNQIVLGENRLRAAQEEFKEPFISYMANNRAALYDVMRLLMIKA